MKCTLYLFATLALLMVFDVSCSNVISPPEPQESSWAFRIQFHGEPPDDYVFQGHYVYVEICLDSADDRSLDGFNFLIAYNSDGLTFIYAELLEATECWEYFTYDLGPFDGCGNDCPSGLVRLSGLRDVNYGPYHPEGCKGADGFFDSSGVEIAQLKFYVTDDRTFECDFLPIYFYWLDCEDNTITCCGNETKFVSNRVFDISWETDRGYREIFPPDGSIDLDDHIYGAWEICEDNFGSGYLSNRVIDFFNGGIDIACAVEPVSYTHLRAHET